jgi:hypothetical protein
MIDADWQEIRQTAGIPKKTKGEQYALDSSFSIFAFMGSGPDNWLYNGWLNSCSNRNCRYGCTLSVCRGPKNIMTLTASKKECL